MGAAFGVVAKTSPREPYKVRVSAIEGHRNWAASYDAGPNPLLALETRLVLERLSPLASSRFLDVACGTGRWMLLAQQRGCSGHWCRFLSGDAARSVAQAGPGRMSRLSPMPATFRLPTAQPISHSVLLRWATSRLHFRRSRKWPGFREKADAWSLPICIPARSAAGWTRSFRSQGQVYEIDHHHHRDCSLGSCRQIGGLGSRLGCRGRLWRTGARDLPPGRERFVVPGIEPHSRAAGHVLD